MNKTLLMIKSMNKTLPTAFVFSTPCFDLTGMETSVNWQVRRRRNQGVKKTNLMTNQMDVVDDSFDCYHDDESDRDCDWGEQDDLQCDFAVE